MSEERSSFIMWILLICLHSLAGKTTLRYDEDGDASCFFLSQVPRPYVIISSTTREQNFKMGLQLSQDLCSTSQGMGIPFPIIGFIGLVLPIQFSTNGLMEEPIAVTLARICFFNDSDIDLVNTKHILDSNALFPA